MNTIKFSLVVAFFAWAGFSGSSHAQDGLVWSINGRAGTSYLVGTSHFSPLADYKKGLPEAVRKALLGSSSIFFESNIIPIKETGEPDWKEFIKEMPARFPQVKTEELEQQKDIVAANKTFARQLEGGEILNPKLPKAVVDKINQAVDQFYPPLTSQDAAINRASRNSLASASEGWLLWSIPTVLHAKLRLQNPPALGLDSLLLKEAMKDGKSIGLLEPYPELMKTMSDIINEGGLEANLFELINENLLPNSDEYADSVSHLAYSGELVELEKALDLQARSSRTYKNIYIPSISIRNKRWINQIVDRLESKKCPCVFAVGGAHLIGNEGLVNLLESKGYRTARVTSDTQ